MSMVMGLAPVVGIPLPFVSHGGSSLMTIMICIGTIMAVERWGRLDTVIPNAGIGAYGGILDHDDAVVAEMDETLMMHPRNAASPCFCSIIHRAAAWVMK